MGVIEKVKPIVIKLADTLVFRTMRRLFIPLLTLSMVLLAACQDHKNHQGRASEVFPPVSVQNVALFRLSQLPVSPVFFEGHWTVVVFGQAACEQDCQHRLQLVNAVQDTPSLFVITDLADHRQLQTLAKQHPSVAISMGTTASAFDNFYRQFDLESIAASEKHQFIYLVNPDAELAYTLAVAELREGDIDKELALLHKVFLAEQ